MKVYLDACCLNRLTDDQSQARIRRESEAVELIPREMRDGRIQWISSEALAEEIAGRARDLHNSGYGAFDSLHLACAEAAQVDALLTTDDGFIRKASRRDGSPRVAVRNPLSWSQEELP